MRPEIDYLGPGEPPASAGKRLKGGLTAIMLIELGPPICDMLVNVT